MTDTPNDPTRAAQRLMRPELPKRFYKAAESVETTDGFAVALDGRPLRTPAKRLLAVPRRALAEDIAGEWAAQGERIDPATMPLTRLVNVAIDGVTDTREAVAEEVVKYAASDLLCYRAEAPERLVERQAAHWDPILAWAREAMGLRFVLVEGVVFADQPVATLEAVRAAVAPLDPLRLAALHTVVALTGSSVIGLALAQGAIDVEGAWTAAHVDEDWTIELWGEDAEATARRVHRFVDMKAAARVLRLLAEA
jgi:chaperone required for assembly of F1-ATPase